MWCRDVNTRSGCSLACSAIHCCFVDVFVELSVSSVVSHQWVWTCDASLSSDGSRWPRFSAVSGTMKALRLPAPHALRLMVSPAGSMGSRIFVSARALPATCRPVAGPGSLLVTLAVPFQRFSSWARTGPHRFPGDPSRGSAPFQDPGRPVAPRRSRCFRCCSQAQHTEGVVIHMISRLTEPLHHLLSTLHDSRCRLPCKTRFRLAGCAFAGRASNPLGREERFQFISSPFPGLTLSLVGATPRSGLETVFDSGCSRRSRRPD